MLNKIAETVKDEYFTTHQSTNLLTNQPTYSLTNQPTQQSTYPAINLLTNQWRKKYLLLKLTLSNHAQKRLNLQRKDL